MLQRFFRVLGRDIGMPHFAVLNRLIKMVDGFFHMFGRFIVIFFGGLGMGERFLSMLGRLWRMFILAMCERLRRVLDGLVGMSVPGERHPARRQNQRAC